MTALSGSETVEQAYALGRLLRGGLGAHAAVLPGGDLRRARRVPAAALGDRAGRARRRARRRAASPSARRSSTSGSRRRAARRRGRHRRPDGTVQRARRSRSRDCRELAAPATSSATAARLRAGGPDLVGLAAAAAAHGSPRSRTRSGSRTSPAAARSTCPRRRTAAASPRRGPRPPTTTRPNPEPIGLLIVSGDEAAADPAVRALAEHAERGARDHDVPRARRRLGRPRPAGDELPRARRDVVNLEGRLQRLRRAVIPPCAGRARLDREARRALRRRALAAPGGRLRRARARRSTAALPSSATVGEQAPLPARAAYERAGPRPAHDARPPATERARRALPRHAAPAPLPAALLRPRRRARARAPVPAPGAEVELALDGRRAPRDRRPATRSRSARTAPRSSCARASTGSLLAGVVRDRRRARRRPPPRRRGGEGAVTRAVVDLADQGVRDHQPRAGRASRT